ncbi:YiiQ family protein [Providencia sp.]
MPQLTFAQKVPTLPDTDFEVSYLAPDAPSFDLTIPQLRNQFNQAYKDLYLHEYKVIASQDIAAPYIRAASRINQQIYSSAVLERGSEKIKSIQITLLPTDNPQEAQENRQIMERYTIALIHQFAPDVSLDKAPELTEALNKFMANKNSTHAEEAKLGALRYILVKSDNNVLTFAVEPIKLEQQTP